MSFERTPIIAFVGLRGSGKSLLMSIFLQAREQDGDALFVNYGYTSTKARRMDKRFLKSFFDTKGEAFLHSKNATIAIDELPTFMDAYDFRSKAAKVFSYFVLQTRKRGISFYYTAQQMRLVPIRIRDNTDLIVMPTYDKERDCILYSIFRYDYPYSELIKKLVITHVSRFFHLYDTQEIIDVLDKDE